MARVVLIAGLAESLVNFRGPLIEALLAAGHQVAALGPEAQPATLAWLGARGVAYRTVPLARAGLSPGGDLATYRAIRAELSTLKPDAVIAYTIKPVVYGMLAARAAGVPHRHAMITGLGYAFTDGAASLKRRLVGLVARRLYRLGLGAAETVLFQNPDDLAVFQRLGLLPPAARIGIVNGSGVDTAAFMPAPLPDAPKLLMISRLVADKGVGEFLAAARIVKAQRPEAEFTLIGPADPNPAALPPGLLDAAVADGIVQYPGETADVRPALAEASIYVLPSYREGTPRSVLEAMAMGRAVITTDAPGCRETVQNGVNGLLVPVKDAAALAQAMLRLIDNPATRAEMGARGRAIAVTKYDAGEVARSVLALTGLERTG